MRRIISHLLPVRAIRPAVPVSLASVVLFAVALPFAQGQVRWSDSWQSAQAQAQQSRRPLFVYFYTNKANECFRFQRETLTAPTVIAYLNANFVCLAVDASIVKNLAGRYGVLRVPAVLLLAPDGKEFARFVTYYPPDRLVESLKKSLTTAPEAAEAVNPAAPSFRRGFSNVIFAESFESLTGWNNNASSAGATANINLIRGVYGKAFAIEYQLRNDTYNYIQLHKELSPQQQFTLPEKYTVILHLAGKGGANSFDLKFADEDGTNYGAIIPIPLDFKGRRIALTSDEIGYLWGEDRNMGRVKYFLIGISPLSKTWPQSPDQVTGALYLDELVIVPGIVKD
ncbi:MAG: hypothetical protein Kow0059_08520 [Candidatus Sumerlaeia bacterium]